MASSDVDSEINSITSSLNGLAEVMLGQTLEIRSLRQQISAMRDSWVKVENNITAKTGFGDEINSLKTDVAQFMDTVESQRVELHDSQEQINTIFKYAPDAVVVIDSQGRIVRWNPAAENKFGWSEQEVIGQYLHDILVPDRFREQHVQGIKRFLKTGVAKFLNRSVQMPALHKNKKEVEMELTISPAKLNDQYFFIAFLRDITERLKHEEIIRRLNRTLEERVQERTVQLEYSEEKYRNLFENNPMALWVLELPSLRFLDVNDSALLQYGYTREEFLSMTAFDIRPPEDKVMFQQLDRNATGTNNKGIWRHLKKDGSTIYAEVTVHEITYEGKPSRFVLSNDVTERKKMEDQILELNRRLEERVVERTKELVVANKELESFSYSVSHDLRVPLRAINGYSQILIEDYADKLDAEGIRLLNIVKANAKKMGQLVDDLLSFSRIGKRELNYVNINLNSIVDNVVNDLKRTESIRADLRIHSLGEVYGDPAVLQLLFQNLISNAIKYSSKSDKAKIEIGTMQQDGVPVYYIKDNGVGFNMAYYDKLFGVFQRLHRDDEFEGTGVGLAISHRIVERHGGKIWAEGKVNDGATFFFTLTQ